MTLSAISHHGSGSGVFPALVFVQGNDQKNIMLNRTPFNVGRKVDKDLVIADPRVSRDHAQIVLEGDDFYLIDQGSKHGTFVNGERIQRQKLERNDRLEFGARDPRGGRFGIPAVRPCSSTIMTNKIKVAADKVDARELPRIPQP